MRKSIFKRDDNVTEESGRYGDLNSKGLSFLAFKKLTDVKMKDQTLKSLLNMDHTTKVELFKISIDQLNQTFTI